jgi:hypothetical protein
LTHIFPSPFFSTKVGDICEGTTTTMLLASLNTSQVDNLAAVQQSLFDAQWQTAIITAHCHRMVDQRKLEMRDEVRPWTESVEALYLLASSMSEQLAIVHDSQATLRAVRQDIREQESAAQNIVGASNAEVQGLLRSQDTRRHLLEVVEELLVVCSSLSSQMQDLDKHINSVLC